MLVFSEISLWHCDPNPLLDLFKRLTGISSVWPNGYWQDQREEFSTTETFRAVLHLHCMVLLRTLYLNSLLNLRRLPNASSGRRPFICTWPQMSQRFLVISWQDFISKIKSNHVWSELSSLGLWPCWLHGRPKLTCAMLRTLCFLHASLHNRSILKGKTIIRIKLFMNICFQLGIDTN